MKLPVQLRLPADLRALVLQLTQLLSRTNDQVNRLAEGSISAAHAAATAEPTTGTWVRGDVLRNSAPSELGSAGSKYIVTGWICVQSGTPGIWVATRSLTGN